MSTVRSFITPNLPQAVKLYLEQVSHDLSERILGVRWVRPDGVYQTLNFFGGGVEAERIPGIARSIDQAARVKMALISRLLRLGFSPNLHEHE